MRCPVSRDSVKGQSRLYRDCPFSVPRSIENRRPSCYSGAMKQQRRVVLYGSSLILGTVGWSLERYPELEVLRLASPLPEQQELAALAPDVVLFDVRSSRPNLAGSMLEARPGLLLIGLDADSDRAVIWTGEGSRALSAEDLFRVMTGRPESSVRVTQARRNIQIEGRGRETSSSSARSISAKGARR